MDNSAAEERSHEYFIQLPINEAIEVRDELESAIWEIARQEGVEDTLKEAHFDVRIGKPAIDINTVITVIITYIGLRTLDNTYDKLYDKAWNAWVEKVWPGLKQKFGDTFLAEKGKKKNNQEDQ